MLLSPLRISPTWVVYFFSQLLCLHAACALVAVLPSSTASTSTLITPVMTTTMAAATRRDVIGRASVLTFGGAIGSGIAVLGTAPLSADAKSATAGRASSLGISLQDRLKKQIVSRPEYSIEASDVYYPDWFRGTWDCVSVAKNVEAPMGEEAFGGKLAFDKAMEEIGKGLAYQARFRAVGDMETIADRVFNIDSITTAAMGSMAVLNIDPEGAPNVVAFYLSPAGAAGAVYKAELRCMGRHVEAEVDELGRDTFDCLEFSRSIVTREGLGVPKGADAPKLIKDIETTTLYTKINDRELVALQRTASFLPPPRRRPTSSSSSSATTSPTTALSPSEQRRQNLYDLSQGKAVDVRCYEVTYKLRGAAPSLPA